MARTGLVLAGAGLAGLAAYFVLRPKPGEAAEEGFGVVGTPSSYPSAITTPAGASFSAVKAKFSGSYAGGNFAVPGLKLTLTQYHKGIMWSAHNFFFTGPIAAGAVVALGTAQAPLIAGTAIPDTATPGEITADVELFESDGIGTQGASIGKLSSPVLATVQEIPASATLGAATVTGSGSGNITTPSGGAFKTAAVTINGSFKNGNAAALLGLQVVTTSKVAGTVVGTLTTAVKAASVARNEAVAVSAQAISNAIPVQANNVFSDAQPQGSLVVTVSLQEYNPATGAVVRTLVTLDSATILTIGATRGTFTGTFGASSLL